MPSNTLPLLLVEADPDVLAAMLNALEFEGYQVAAARNVWEALKRLAGMGRTGLVLLDGGLEEAERARLLRRLQEDDVPVVLLSAHDDEPPGPEVRAVLRKPFNLDMLYATVAAHCETREAPRLIPANRDVGFLPVECGSFGLPTH